MFSGDAVAFGFYSYRQTDSMIPILVPYEQRAYYSMQIPTLQVLTVSCATEIILTHEEHI